MAEIVADATCLAGLASLWWSFMVYFGGGLAVLDLALVMSVMKPEDPTDWGSRDS